MLAWYECKIEWGQDFWLTVNFSQYIFEVENQIKEFILVAKYWDKTVTNFLFHKFWI